MEDEIYKRYEELKIAKDVTDYKVAQETKVSTVTLSKWKQGAYVPKDPKLQAIADYFGVSLHYLKTGKEITEQKYTAESASLVAKIRNDAELVKALEKYFSMTPDKKKHVIDTINMLSEGK